MHKFYIMIFTWLIGGPQGTGVDTSANSFARSCAYAGYWVFGKREYHSNIIGEHSYFVVTVSDKDVGTFRDKIDVLVSFEERTLRTHIEDVADGGAVIYDEETDISKYSDYIKSKNLLMVPVPYRKIIAETSEKFGLGDVKKLDVMRNSISVFASGGILELPSHFIEKSMDYIFVGKRRKVLEPNKYAGMKGYEIGKMFSSKFPIKAPEIKRTQSRVILTGTQATAFGKIIAGCRFQTYYPITPATDESEFLESLAKRYDFVVIQAEDEIAALLMSIGASLGGARAATSSSGPGFSLMAEGMGWAGMNEVPVVIINYQRGGPSTGLPTRHEQADLKFAINAGHGEFPRVILAPGDIEEAMYITAEAFNIAEKYQLPVVVIEDKFIANSVRTIPQPDMTKFKIQRGKFDSKVPNGDHLLKDLPVKVSKFKRFELPSDRKDYVSPRIPLGYPGFVFWNTGDEHDEYGHITEDPENRTKMHEKRMKKLEQIVEETPDEQKVSVFGNPNSEFVIVSWGSTKGGIISAMEEFADKFLFVQVKMIHPLDSSLIKKYISGRIKIAVEQNYTAQLASLITEKTGEFFDYFVLKWNGRPMSWDDLVYAFGKILDRKAEKRIVLTSGK
ncbi:MAG: 2-oxoacid:acceptor oxidoreductase subunit alpha [Candidatus Calescibacterium sp.]|nr:2-oxoacid:acceptor oxidoreductase subunit alpha [Candidatus Calescibacterium sp.]